MADSKLPGLSLAVVLDGDPVYSRGFGFRDLASGASTSADTLYCIGSVTKSFTALSILQLQEQYKLNIEDPVDDFIPLNIKPKGEEIKVKHLLNHSSGIPALAYAEAAQSHITHETDVWMPISNTRDLITFMKDSESWADAKPGEKWFYLNEGYIILGSIIEIVSKQKYTDYVINNILKPLNMNRSYFTKEAEKDPEFATPYTITSNGERIPGSYTYGEMLSDGGLISSVNDMTRYIQMLLNEGKYKGKKIAESESIHKMMKSDIIMPDILYDGNKVFYGCGLNVRPGFLGRRLVQHSGSVYVSTAYLGLIPEEVTGVMVMANGSGYPTNLIGEYALGTFLNEDPLNIPSFKTENFLDSLTGKYEAYMGTMKFNVVRKGGLLNIEIKDTHYDYSVPLLQDSPGTTSKKFFVYTMDRKIPVDFVQEEDKTWLIYERFKMQRTNFSK